MKKIFKWYLLTQEDIEGFEQFKKALNKQLESVENRSKQNRKDIRTLISNSKRT